MTIRLFSVVRVLTDRYASKGVPKGDTGTVVEDWRDGSYEVEFSRDTGETYALFAIGENELEVVWQPKN